MDLYVGQVFYNNGQKLEIVKMDSFKQIIVCRYCYSKEISLVDFDREQIEKAITEQTKGVE